MSKYEYCYKTTAIKLLGISKAKFETLGLSPDKTVPNPHYRSGPPAYLFNRETIEKMAATPEIEAMRPKPKKSVDYAARFAKRYGTPQDALLDVADAMFNLNRYAKHETCRAGNRTEIYDLKSRFIKWLYDQGYCQSCYLHITVGNSVTCWGCDGTGLWSSWDGFDIDRCRKCDGTGRYKKKKFEFAVFRFVIDDHPFCWHQPTEKLTFSPNYTSDQPTAMNETETKPLEIAYRKLTESKQLVKWFLQEL